MIAKLNDSDDYECRHCWPKENVHKTSFPKKVGIEAEIRSCLTAGGIKGIAPSFPHVFADALFLLQTGNHSRICEESLDL